MPSQRRQAFVDHAISVMTAGKSTARTSTIRETSARPGSTVSGLVIASNDHYVAIAATARTFAVLEQSKLSHPVLPGGPSQGRRGERARCCSYCEAWARSLAVGHALRSRALAFSPFAARASIVPVGGGDDDHAHPALVVSISLLIPNGSRDVVVRFESARKRRAACGMVASGALRLSAP